MNRFLKVFRIPDLRKKIFFVLAMLIIFRAAAAIPIPGINVENLKNFFESNQLFSLISAFTGGGLDSFSIVMLGLGPYITGSIIMQLLTMIFPRLEQMYKYEGEAGRQKFNQYSRMLTIPLAMLQGFAFITFLSRQPQAIIGDMNMATWINALIVIAAGSVFLMWLGELITEKNIGNGVSLLIFAGIVAGAPTAIKQALFNYRPDLLISYIVFVIISIIVIAGVVYLTEAQRKIPINYAKRVRGFKTYGGVSTYLPMRVNNAGVMPIIFALSLLLFPSMIGNFLTVSSNEILKNIGEFVTKWFVNNVTIYSVLYFALVVVFTYFYTAVTFDPKSISENIQKQGGYIPGIRPGRPTADFLSHLLNRVTLVGAMFLGIIAVLPQIVRGTTGVTAFAVGGTSILIVVSVVLETIKALDAQLSMYEY